MEMSRRDFLKAGFVTVGVGMGVPSVFGRAAWAAELERAHGASLAAYSRKTVVLVQLTGGHDHLDTVIPIGTAGTPIANYHTYRPAAGTLDRTGQINGQLSSFFPVGTPATANVYNQFTNFSTKLVSPGQSSATMSLHPALQRLAAWYNQGKLAVINNVGYGPSSYDLSHFRAMDIYQSARPDTIEFSGWFGRYFNSYQDPDYPTVHPIKAMNNGSTLPLALRGNVYTVPSITSVSSYQLQTDNSAGSPATEDDLRRNTLLGSYTAFGNRTAPFAALLSTTAQEAYSSSIAVQASTAGYNATTPVTYPNTSLGNGFKILAQIITQGLGARVLHISLGGFDTHSAQTPALYNNALNTNPGAVSNPATGTSIETNPGLWKRLDDAMDAFYRDLTARGWGDDVVVMTWTEFGRRLKQNNSGGTDHGKASQMIVLGGAVNGGQIYGGETNLNAYNAVTNPVGVDANGDLRHSIDFRQVYATVLERWMQTAAVPIIPGQQGATGWSGSAWSHVPFLPG